MNPVESLSRLSSFLQTDLCHALAYCHVATIFDISDGRLILSKAFGSAWAVLPSEWRSWAMRSTEDKQGLLKRLARGETDDNMPTSLRDFLETCASLQLNRECSDSPVLSSRAARNIRQRPSIPFDSLGMKRKKTHEVERCLGVISELLEGAQNCHILDVGAGRAHLSRVLTLVPLNAHVLAVDNSDSQLKGSDRLVDLTNRFHGPLGSLTPPLGSLVHELNHLDEDSLAELLIRWPPASAKTPALLLALHACGDLTPNTLRSFVKVAQNKPDLRACVVGCCYNLLRDDASNFPLSSALADLNIKLERDARMLAAQAPSQWLMDESKMLSMRKLAMRARLGAELRHYALCNTTQNERVGRPADGVYDTYESFRQVALRRLQIARDWPIVPLMESWDTMQFAVAFFWTIRAQLGPVIESLIILDRFLYLVEELAETAYTVELHALFDQRKDSLRNMTLIVR